MRVGGVTLILFFFSSIEKWQTKKTFFVTRKYNLKFQFVVHTGKNEPERRSNLLTEPWLGARKDESFPKLTSTYFICLFNPNVNMLIVVKVLECIHASTVEHRLPQLRGWGVVVALGTPPCPHWAPARTDTSVPRTLLSIGARHRNTALNWGAQVILYPRILPVPHFLPAKPSF